MTNQPESPTGVNARTPTEPMADSVSSPRAVSQELAGLAASLTRAIRDGRYSEASTHVEAYRVSFDRLLESLPADSAARRSLILHAYDLFVWAKHEAEVSRAHMQARLSRSDRVLSYSRQGASNKSILRTEY